MRSSEYAYKFNTRSWLSNICQKEKRTSVGERIVARPQGKAFPKKRSAEDRSGDESNIQILYSAECKLPSLRCRWPYITPYKLQPELTHLFLKRNILSLLPYCRYKSTFITSRNEVAFLFGKNRVIVEFRLPLIYYKLIDIESGKRHLYCSSHFLFASFIW